MSLINIGSGPNAGDGDPLRTAFQKINNAVRIKLTEDTTYYVATTGSDSTGDGSSGAPWETIQFAVDYVVQKLDLGGDNQVTINVADGTYNEGVYLGNLLGNEIVDDHDFPRTVNIIGNDTTPSNCIVQNAGGGDPTWIFGAAGGTANWYISGFRLQSTSGYAWLVNADQNALVNVGNIECGNSGGSSYFNASNRSVIQCFGSTQKWLGTTALALSASGGSFIDFEIGALTIDDGAVFSTCGLFANLNSEILFAPGSIVNTNSGATGPKYMIYQGGRLVLFGSDPTQLPGSSNGAIDASGSIDGNVFTVAKLPSASMVAFLDPTGARAFVTDANSTTFHSTVAGGGSNKVPVVSDGTNWLIG